MNIKTPLRKQAKLQSVVESTREVLGEESEFAKEFEDRLGKRQIVKTLAIIRARANLSQKELAAAMDCSQSKVSKLESGDDGEVSIDDLTAYLKAIRHEARISIVPEGGTIVDEVKLHALQIKHLLDRMVELARDDTDITRGVKHFIEEAALNLTRITQMAAAALPHIPAERRRSIQVDAPQTEDESKTRKKVLRQPASAFDLPSE